MLPPPAQGRLNHSMFISRMPIKAKPRRASKKSMRCAALTGPGNVLPESVPLDLFISDNSRFESSRPGGVAMRSEEHTSELQSLMRISYAVFCLKKKNTDKQTTK